VPSAGELINSCFQSIFVELLAPQASLLGVWQADEDVFEGLEQVAKRWCANEDGDKLGSA
jgi:hypothetical protein